MANGSNNYNFADLKLDKTSDTFRNFERIIKKQGYTNLKAGFLAAINYYVQQFSGLLDNCQEKSSPD